MLNSFEQFRRSYTLTCGWAIFAFSVIATLWTFYEVNSAVEIPYVENELVTKLLSKFILVGLACLLLVPIIFLIERVVSRKKIRIIGRRLKIHSEYKVEFAELAQLEEVVKFGMLLVGDSHIDIETLKRRHMINSRIITCLYSREADEGRTELIGYYILYPLTQEAHLLIQNCEIMNGRGLKDEHIAQSFLRCSALYIGMVGGKGVHAEGYVIEEMLQQISPILGEKSLKAIYTRGATEDGIRVTKDFGFQKLSEPSEISCVFINSDILKSKRLDRHLAYR